MQRLSRILGVTMLAVLLSGCAADPSVEPTPTPPRTFASEDEAFAAAEATYRAYVDALNQVDLADPSTFEEVYAWTTGEANAQERETLSEMHTDGWRVTGTTVVHAADRDASGQMLICVDVSAVDVTDAMGYSQVPPERPDKYALSVTFDSAKTDTGLRIATSRAVESDLCG